MFPLCKPMKIDGVSSENSSVQFLVQFPLLNFVHELPTQLRVVSDDLTDNFLHCFDSGNTVRVCTIHIRYGRTGDSGIGIVPVPGVPVMTRPSRTGLGRVGEPWFSYAISDMPVYFDDPPVVHTYNRFPEIEKECSPFLSSASELKPDDVRGYKIRKELSFFQGDWTQELGRSPLVPFDDSDLPGDSLSVSSPLRLVGFEVKDVNPVHQLKNAVSLHGTMCIGMARNSTLIYDPRSNMYMAPGMSVLKIDFEGVYIETEKDGGQRLLCMLGNTTLPFRTSAPGTSSFTISLSNNRPRLLQDGRLLLVLHYPNILSLTKRAILGELKSLNEPKNPRYFDVIHISSQLNAFSKYKFSSEKLKSRTCDLRLFRQDLDDDGANRFNNTEFCIVMCSFSGYLFNIVPN